MLSTLLGATVKHCDTLDEGKVVAITYIPENATFRLLVKRTRDNRLLSWSHENCDLLNKRNRRGS